MLLFSLELRSDLAKRAAKVLRRAANQQLEALGLAHRELSLSLVSDRAMRAINREHRGKDKTTDVLSFPQEEPGHAARASGPIGDVVISLQTAVRQAREGGWTLERELERLLAHGVLHCLGHDHESAREAKRMATAERRLLGREGMVGESFPELRAKGRAR